MNYLCIGHGGDAQGMAAENSTTRTYARISKKPCDETETITSSQLDYLDQMHLDYNVDTAYDGEDIPNKSYQGSKAEASGIGHGDDDVQQPRREIGDAEQNIDDDFHSIISGSNLEYDGNSPDSSSNSGDDPEKAADSQSEEHDNGDSIKSDGSQSEEGENDDQPESSISYQDDPIPSSPCPSGTYTGSADTEVANAIKYFEVPGDVKYEGYNFFIIKSLDR